MYCRKVVLCEKKGSLPYVVLFMEGMPNVSVGVRLYENSNPPTKAEIVGLSRVQTFRIKNRLVDCDEGLQLKEMCMNILEEYLKRGFLITERQVQKLFNSIFDELGEEFDCVPSISKT